jgi:cardiolipin synthase
MDWLDKIARFWPHLAAGFDFLAALIASFHCLLHKRDPRAATLWLGIIWFLPLFGPLLYLILGFNRIRRRAVTLGVMNRLKTACELTDLPQLQAEHLKNLATVVQRIVKRPLTTGNKIEPLVNGDQAFPAMLQAIDSAKISVSFCTYIFDNDASGKKFIDAFSRALERGVAVRVLVDSAGTRYSWPPITWKLRHAKIPFVKFLPASLLAPWRLASINLRNHRKLLIIDGKTAFTGGINIRHGNVLADKPKSPIQDLHFQVTGPVVAQLQEAFASDWYFCTDEIIEGEKWFPPLESAGEVIARVIPDGPDADFEKLRLTLLAALAEAQSSVQILTPYFLPDVALISALNLAALRGVKVDIILPQKSNLLVVRWASRAMWWQVLERGCRIWLTSPPFDHSKLMIVDGHWVQLGSANWDPRSLRLNFELNVECYGRGFADDAQKLIQNKLAGARQVTLAEMDQRSVPSKLRDAIARLFSPFL